MTELPERVKLLAGKGDVLTKLQSLRTELQLQERVQILEARPYDQLMRITAVAIWG